MTTTEGVEAGLPSGNRVAAGWRPLAGAALLERLRVTGRARPASDPRLVADLRSLIGDVPTASEGRGTPLVVTKDRLHRSLACPAHAGHGPSAGRGFSPSLACGALVDVLFRQLVTTGTVGDALADGIDGLGLDEFQAPLLAWIRQLAPAERSELRSEVDRQIDGLRRRWPALDPAWLPRTQERIRVPLADGRIELMARVDLAVGRPAADEASVALIDVTSGCGRAAHRADRHFLALVETLRGTTPPFAVATYSTRTGELDVDPVTSELLVDAARRCRAAIGVLGGGEAVTAPDPTARPWCPACSEVPRTTVGRPPPGAPEAYRSAAAVSDAVRPAAPSPGAVDEVLSFPEERAA